MVTWALTKAQQSLGTLSSHKGLVCCGKNGIKGWQSHKEPAQDVVVSTGTLQVAPATYSKFKTS